MQIFQLHSASHPYNISTQATTHHTWCISDGLTVFLDFREHIRTRYMIKQLYSSVRNCIRLSRCGQTALGMFIIVAVLDWIIYVFARLLVLNFVCDASFAHPRSEVEDNYPLLLPLPSYPKLCPSPHWCPIIISYLFFTLWLWLYDCLLHEHLQNFPYSFIIVLSSSLDILGQITLLAASLARCF